MPRPSRPLVTLCPKGANLAWCLVLLPLAWTIVLASCGAPPEQGAQPAPEAESVADPPVVPEAKPVLVPLVQRSATAVDEPKAEVDWNPSGVLTGTWSGAWNFYGRAVEGAAKVTLRHYDDTFNGYIEMTPDVGAVCGKTSGTIVWGLQFDDYVTFGFYDLYSYGFTFHGTVDGNRLFGEFLAITDCGAESGTFRLTL